MTNKDKSSPSSAQNIDNISLLFWGLTRENTAECHRKIPAPIVGEDVKSNTGSQDRSNQNHGKSQEQNLHKSHGKDMKIDI